MTLHLPNFADLSKEELIVVLNKVIWDAHTGFLSGNAAAALGASVEAGDIAVYLDFCNVHACNHFYGGLMGTNTRWINCFTSRGDDTIIKWGGDEIVVLLKNYDVEGYIHRLVNSMKENNVYAVITIVRTSSDLIETIARADTICTSVKNELERTGKKPHRDAPYVCLDSIVVYEETL